MPLPPFPLRPRPAGGRVLVATLLAGVLTVSTVGGAVADVGAEAADAAGAPAADLPVRKGPSAAQRNGSTAAHQDAVGQPYAPHWFPNELLAWDPESDPDAGFNRSTVPLRDRVQDDLTGANPDAAARQVMALSVFGHTSGNPSQGTEEFDAYLSEFWPYLDTLVFWGGSAGEGLILAPNPTVTDAAHRNGVPVLGTVFLPPEAYGGKLTWTRQLLQRDEDGDFPVAKKLVRAARYYGFDGWFVNAETEGADPELAADMRDFVQALSGSGLKVLWYDSMVESGEIAWQNALNDKNDAFFAASDMTFLNYWWDEQMLRDSAEHAKALGRDPADLHAGVDVGSRQFDIQDSLDTLYPPSGDDSAGSPSTAGDSSSGDSSSGDSSSGDSSSGNSSGVAGSDLSLGLYRPDFTLTGTDDPSAYAQRESRFWVGADGDPARSAADDSGFRGVSSDVWEHTSVTGTPFATSFGTGRGKAWFHDGRRWQTGDWNNLSAQDVLPTWRFSPRGPGAEDVEVGYDYGTAWRGGSSLRIHGEAAARVRLPLFATRLSVEPGTRISLTTRGGADVSLVLSFADAPGEREIVPLGGSNGEEWVTRRAPLGPYAGRTLTRVGVRFEPGGHRLDPGGEGLEQHIGEQHIGELRITDAEDRAARPPAAPEDVRVRRDDDGPGARVFWESSDGSDRASSDRASSGGGLSDGRARAVARYQVEAVNADGERTWLGTTSANAYYARDVPADAVRIEVIGVNRAGVRGDPGSAGLSGTASRGG